MFKMINDRAKEEEIKEKFMQSLYREGMEDRSKEIHISDLVYPCPRSVVLSKHYGVESYEDIDKDFLKKTWAGKKLHETGFGDITEYGFKYKFCDDDETWCYIYGSADEVFVKDGIVLDKKFYAFTPKKPYEHHLYQVGFYIVILRELGLDVSKGAVMYINRYDLYVKVYLFEIEDIGELKKLMLERANVIKESMVNGKIPDGVVSWACRYCKFKYECDEYLKSLEGDNK